MIGVRRFDDCVRRFDDWCHLSVENCDDTASEDSDFSSILICRLIEGPRKVLREGYCGRQNVHGKAFRCQSEISYSEKNLTTRQQNVEI
jgi:hypothetical protein